MKFKRFLRKICRPILVGEFFLLSAGLFIAAILMLKFSPDSFAVMDATMQVISELPFSPATVVLVIWTCGAIGGFLLYGFYSLCFSFADWLVNFYVKRREGPDAVKDNLIEVYVDDVVYDRLHQMIEGHNVKLPEFCSMVLESVDPVDLD